MAEVKWTAEQKKVIELRNRNILVSAAAGSGKTAVLVERIISMITEGTHPLDVDRLLVVTFTKAAAAEMRERVSAAIEERLLADADNEHLQKQQTLLHGAQITTIDSFCMYVVRQYFHVIDLDPSFRVGEDAELLLIKSDVIGEILEKKYLEAEPEFLNFIECYAPGKSDQVLEDLILGLYEFARSYPWPEEWLDEKADCFGAETIEELNEKDWMKKLFAEQDALIRDLMRRNEEAAAICREEGGPENYLPALMSDADLLLSLTGLPDYESRYRVFSELNFARLSAKRDPLVDETKKDGVKAIREEIKKGIGDLKKEFYFQEPSEMLADMNQAAGAVRVLVELTKEFAAEFAAKKEEKNILDFGDLEHFALRILVEKQDGNVVPTAAARELSSQFDEIMIDEYQDSNLVQETVLNSISKEREGRPNTFMVGDVKQSIYKFRLARPELFLHKYLSYSTEDSSYQRIDLHRNFRSRANVLHSANYIFEQIMTEALGGIAYDESAALYPGAEFAPCAQGEVSEHTELLLLDGARGEEETEETEYLLTDEKADEAERSCRELEARMLAERIRELTGDPGLMVWDKGKKAYRKVCYGDIVILLRTMSGWSETFVDTLGALGIPAYADTQTGYFQTVEIKTMLNLLRILDNPRQDIPFAAVLYSPIVGLKSRDLAEIRCDVKSEKPLTLYETVRKYAAAAVPNGLAVPAGLAVSSGTAAYAGAYNEAAVSNEPAAYNEAAVSAGSAAYAGKAEPESGIGKKLTGFLTNYDRWRSRVALMPVHELIEMLFQETGYYDYVSVMPAGEKRQRNMDQLVTQAVSFEQAGYHGLFHFVRYVEKLLKYDVDYGEASVIGENDNTVRIMSIHKSKGLEFPVVIAAGLGKAFNNSDARARVVLHPDLGIGPDFIDPEKRVKSPTLLKKAIQRSIKLENLAEELRVLYVALTRAKEKLILSGYVKDLEKQLGKWSGIGRQREREFLLHRLTSAGNFLDYVVPALIRHPDLTEFAGEGRVVLGHAFAGEDKANFTVSVKKASDLARDEIRRQENRIDGRKILFTWDPDRVYNKQIREEIERIRNYAYPYENQIGVPVKLTVSELKRAEQQTETEGKELIPPEKEPVVPRFISKQTPVTAAARGTMYHKLLMELPWNRALTADEIKTFIQSLVKGKRLPAEAEKLIRPSDIEVFVNTPVAERMRLAQREGRLFQEQQFMIGLPAEECGYASLADPEQMMLVQGIIDVYFEEEDGLVLLDYKTDYLPDGGEELLKERYGAQLTFYEKALVQMTGKPVKERILYSFALKKTIAV